MSPFWVVLLSNLFSELYINLRGTLRRHFFDRSQRFPKNLPYSRLGQTTPPVSALRLLRRTFLPLAKTVPRTVFFRKPKAFSLLVRIPTDSNKTKRRSRNLLGHNFFFGWGIGIRTPTNRVRVCRATVTQFPNATRLLYTNFS